MQAEEREANEAELLLAEEHIKKHNTPADILRLAAWLTLEYEKLWPLAQELEAQINRAKMDIFTLTFGGESALEHMDMAAQDLSGHIYRFASMNLKRGARLHSKRQAKKGAAAKLANDRKQHAKSDVYNCWLAWQKGTESHKGQAAFARAMLMKWSNVLESQPSIEAWCRQWKKGENIPLIEPAQ